MRINANIKRIVIDAYNDMAKELYKEFSRDFSVSQIRLQIAQIIMEHVMSKANEDITTSKRITKNKVTRAANQRLTAMSLEDRESRIDEIKEKREQVQEFSF